MNLGVINAHPCSNMPFPSTLAGFTKLTKEQWIMLLPLLSTLCVLFLLTSLLFSSPAPTNKKKGYAAPALLLCAGYVRTPHRFDFGF